MNLWARAGKLGRLETARHSKTCPRCKERARHRSGGTYQCIRCGHKFTPRGDDAAMPGPSR